MNIFYRTRESLIEEGRFVHLDIIEENDASVESNQFETDATPKLTFLLLKTLWAAFILSHLFFISILRI